MFDRYFSPDTAARLRDGPDAVLLLDLLTHLQKRGHTGHVVRTYLKQADRFLVWLRRHQRPLASIDEASIRSFACPPPRVRPLANIHAALHHLLDCLRCRGLVPARSGPVPTVAEEVIARFDAHLAGVAGFADATRLYCRRYLREFLAFAFGTGPLRWTRLKPDLLLAFIGDYGQRGCPAAAGVAAFALRCFLRWLQFTGLIAADLTEAVPRFRSYRHATLPPALSTQQQQAILGSFDRSAPAGLRNFAMTLCLLRLGLRVGEVAGLVLDDLDAHAGTLRIAPGKSRRERLLPLSAELRDALVAYIQGARPFSTDQHLFLCHRPPIGSGVSKELIRGVVRQVYAKLDGCEQLTGTHVLRHTVATELQRTGADLKQIADILGHRSIDTTAHYAKVDVAHLAEVPLPWPQQSGGQP